MTTARIGAAMVFLVGALVLQTAVVGRFDWPFGAPDLVVLVVVALAVSAGPAAGAGAGCAGGLFADCLSDHPLGVLALVLTVAGYVCGRRAERLHRVLPGLIVLVLLASAAVTLGQAAVLGVLGSDRPMWTSTLLAAPAVAIFDLVLAPVVFLAVVAADRRLAAVHR